LLVAGKFYVLLATIGKPQQLDVKTGSLTINIALPRQAVSLLKLDW
jgi:xylan 1,4-beta-xylosidase